MLFCGTGFALLTTRERNREPLGLNHLIPLELRWFLGSSFKRTQKNWFPAVLRTSENHGTTCAPYWYLAPSHGPRLSSFSEPVGTTVLDSLFSCSRR